MVERALILTEYNFFKKIGGGVWSRSRNVFGSEMMKNSPYNLFVLKSWHSIQETELTKMLQIRNTGKNALHCLLYVATPSGAALRGINKCSRISL
jgi:hypothetical protein